MFRIAKKVVAPSGSATSTSKPGTTRLAVSDSPGSSLMKNTWLPKKTVPEVDGLPAPAVEAVWRVAIDAHRLDLVWCRSVVEALGDARYVELVSVVVYLTAIDVFAEALGVALEPLPDPLEGEPGRVRPDGVGEMGAWVVDHVRGRRFRRAGLG